MAAVTSCENALQVKHALCYNSTRSMYYNFNTTPRLSGHVSIFGLVFFVFKSLLGIARQWSLEKSALMTLKPWISC